MNIAITGVGVLTPYGQGVETLWSSLLESKSAISEMDLFDLGGIICTKAGVIRDFIPPAGFEETPRATAFAAAACIEALRHAGILDNPAALEETALITASNFGNIDFGEDSLIPPDNPAYQPEKSVHCAHSDTSDIIAEKLGLKNLSLSLSLSCASGASVAVTAANLISNGRAKRILIVGYDALSRFSWSGLCALRTMTKDMVRPFDINRSGTIFSEGAAALVLEAPDANNPVPLAYLTGWASGNNGHHMTAPVPFGAGSAYVMSEALKVASLPPEKIDHINTHGTATRANDITETQAIQTTFGEYASTIPATSIKGSLGHMLGAAGAIELIVAALSLQKGVIPPTANLNEQDPDCALNVVISPRHIVMQNILSNSAGFGGCNAALVISKEPARSKPCQAQRVFITGSALISALGCDKDETLAALQENESGCFPLERFEMPGSGLPPDSGEVPELEISEYGISKKPYLDDNSRLMLCACGAAIRDAGHSVESMIACKAGIMAGTAWGCNTTQQIFFADFINKGPRLVKPFIFPHAYTNTAVSLASMEWSLTGPHDNITSACTASGVALIEAYDLIRCGKSRCMLVAGSDALSIPRLIAESSLSPQGEAAAALMLESEVNVSQPQIEIRGCGLAKDCEAALTSALEDAQLEISDITDIYTSGQAQADTRISGVVQQRLEDLSGELAGAATAASLAASLIRGLNGPTLIVTVGKKSAVAIIIAKATTSTSSGQAELQAKEI